MHGRRKRLLVAGLVVAALAASGPAAADITSVSFEGKGTITYSDNPDAPPIGTPVVVTGTVQMGDFYVPDRFTGVVPVNQFNLGQSFFFNVDGAGIAGDSSAVYRGGQVSLVNGRVVSVGLYGDYDGFIAEITPGRFRGITGFHSQDGIIREWGGKWTLVPEPESWALLLLGFAVVGSSLRRRGRNLATTRLRLARSSA